MEVKEKYCTKKPWYRKWWIWMLGVGLTIIPPFFIHLAYMKGSTLKEPNTFFSAGDCLSYYGTLLAALATIVVLYVTILENQKTLQNGMKEHRNRQTRCSRRATASAVAQVKSGYLFALHSASVWAGISFSAQASSAVCANLGARSRTHSK